MRLPYNVMLLIMLLPYVAYVWLPLNNKYYGLSLCAGYDFLKMLLILP